MRILGLLGTIVGVIGLVAVSSGDATAGEVLYDGSGFLQGQQSFDQSFTVAGPGTLTVTLSNIAWPESLTSLNLVLSTSQGLLGPEMQPGTYTFQFGGGQLFAQWFGTAQGPLDLGVYGVKIQWASISAVPLPTSIGLLLSGLALLAWQRRERGGLRSPPPPR